MANNSVLRDQIKEHLLFLIREGRLGIGKTINLAALSRATGISVTPIREALSQLEHARVIKAIPNRGFVVASLSKEEAKDIIGTIAQLEVMALEASPFKKETVEILKKVQQTMENTPNAEDGLQLQLQFHSLLVQGCQNKVLLQVLEDLKLRLSFYEHHLIKEPHFIQKLVRQTRSIVEAIEEDNVPTAALILKMNWMAILELMEAQMDVKKG
ncbi:GntR family transcriptional regulator [Flagellimonas pelagia]|uniref:GntR family transcriptional regulator n=1 Tax=Flagellimonas pelagia TaxID=2306998 RepID=A0A3A1NM84_9FLAO|nr:GntR family transcriptional regulator [Allomuricauda maritima]RIV47540.1 GntR family transcriptional regulator [Allomuricauda maritima]TXK01629.1 GntR family transcriptional regulator [Allomuricauda maritima]